MKTKALLVALCGVAFTAHAWDSSENQVWLEGALKGKLSETLRYRLGEQVRYQEAGFNNYYRHTEPCIQWKFASGWTFAPAFRYSTSTKQGITRSTAAWHLNLINTSSFFGMDLQSRARIYDYAPHGGQEKTDFRPKLCLSPTRGWTQLKLKPLLADELMINVDHGRFYLNRLTLGLTCSPVKHVSLCAFIAQDRLENSTQSAWNERYNYGIIACLNL